MKAPKLVSGATASEQLMQTRIHACVVAQLNALSTPLHCPLARSNSFLIWVSHLMHFMPDDISFKLPA